MPSANTTNPAVIVFSAPVVRQLSTRDGRLEPTYVGVRRVRPSSRAVQEALFKGKATTPTSTTNAASNNTNTVKEKVSNIVFKVVGEDGVERRMTKQEKKARKRQLLREKDRAKRQRQEQREIEAQQQQREKKKSKKRSRKGEQVVMEQETGVVVPAEDEETSTVAATSKFQRDDEEQSLQEEDMDNGSITKGQTESWLEQELADLKGERQGVPPVILAPFLARVSRGILKGGGIVHHPTTTTTRAEEPIELDDDYAQRWAHALQESLQPAVATRQKEDMRSMVYQLVPEVWSRFRPKSLLRNSSLLATKKAETTEVADALTATTSTTSSNKEENTATKQHSLCDNGVQDEVVDGDQEEKESWRFVSIRPLSTRSSFDDDLAAVVKVLYQNTSLHISCGAKFGCDLLLYDGPRNERHAFAGLRVITSTTTPGEKNGVETTMEEDESAEAATEVFPLLSAYCLAGYVRCLNTAAKLALVAAVRRERLPGGSTFCRVGLVDIKLERVDGTKKKDLEVRLQNLQKATITRTNNV